MENNETRSLCFRVQQQIWSRTESSVTPFLICHLSWKEGVARSHRSVAAVGKFAHTRRPEKVHTVAHGSSCLDSAVGGGDLGTGLCPLKGTPSSPGRRHLAFFLESQGTLGITMREQRNLLPQGSFFSVTCLRSCSTAWGCCRRG